MKQKHSNDDHQENVNVLYVDWVESDCTGLCWWYSVVMDVQSEGLSLSVIVAIKWPLWIMSIDCIPLSSMWWGCLFPLLEEVKESPYAVMLCFSSPPTGDQQVNGVGECLLFSIIPNYYLWSNRLNCFWWNSCYGYGCMLLVVNDGTWLRWEQ